VKNKKTNKQTETYFTITNSVKEETEVLTISNLTSGYCYRNSWSGICVDHYFIWQISVVTSFPIAYRPNFAHSVDSVYTRACEWRWYDERLLSEETRT